MRLFTELLTNYETIMKRKCEICGKEITSGYVFDDEFCFCSFDCLVENFYGDIGCAEILVDEGQRVIWHDNLPAPKHFRVNFGHAKSENFHYCDSWSKVCQWIKQFKMDIRTRQDIAFWNQSVPKVCEIGIVEFDPSEYFERRREYVMKLRECEDLFFKVQKIKKSLRRDNLIEKYSLLLEQADDIQEMYPDVWQGEI